LHRFEHNDFPLSWTFAGLAVLAFAVAELWPPANNDRSGTDRQ
jgi:hypothetical protein